MRVWSSNLVTRNPFRIKAYQQGRKVDSKRARDASCEAQIELMNAALGARDDRPVRAASTRERLLRHLGIEPKLSHARTDTAG